MDNSIPFGMLTQTEENYLKALFQLASGRPGDKDAGTNELAQQLEVKPASVHEMLKRLKEKGLVSYERYGRITLTARGRQSAVGVIRKHRLWETFLYEKLKFTWDEVHEVAEQLEHIQSAKLVDRLDEFLGHPKYDPHGDPIPDAKGVIRQEARLTLAEVQEGSSCRMIAVKDNSMPFLQQVMRLGLALKSRIRVIRRNAFDSTLEIEVGKKTHTVSQKFAEHIYVV
jgi:DtxR family Mn-dependent transcriptional regulator